MKTSRLAGAAILAAALSSTTASAQNSLTPEAAASQLSAVLSLLSGGTLGTPENPAKVTREGDAFQVKVPLPLLAEPEGAALTARAQPLAGGVWDIVSASLPATGSFLVVTPQDAGGNNRISYTIGQQAITARVDPTLAQPSPFKVELRNVTISGSNDDQKTEQKIGRHAFEGQLTGEPENRMSLRAQGAITDWTISASDDTGTMRDTTIRSAASSVEMEGLDRGKAEKMRLAMRALTNSVTGTADGKPDMTAQQRTMLQTMIEALQGLVNRIAIDETIEGVHFVGPSDTSGDIGRIRLAMAGESRDDRLNTNIDLAVHDLKVADVPPEIAPYVPTLVRVRPALSGVRTSAVLRLLRRASAGADPDMLLPELIMLLAEPGARLGIETLSLNAGPLKVEANGRMTPPPKNGTPGVEAHVQARGVDATLASLQGNPMAQDALPVMFLIKGMAKTQGDALVWDVAFADGVLKVNGVPFGQPEQKPAPAKPPQKQAPQKRLN